MRKEELRAQRLIEDFPDDSRGIRIKALWKRQKQTDSISLFIFMFGVCPAIGLLLVSVVALYFPARWDSSPVPGVIILALGCSALLFKRGLKGQVLRVWRYLKK